jgi:hypothetical protein
VLTLSAVFTHPELHVIFSGPCYYFRKIRITNRCIKDTW